MSGLDAKNSRCLSLRTANGTIRHGVTSWRCGESKRSSPITLQHQENFMWECLGARHQRHGCGNILCALTVWTLAFTCLQRRSTISSHTRETLRWLGIDPTGKAFVSPVTTARQRAKYSTANKGGLRRNQCPLQRTGEGRFSFARIELGKKAHLKCSVGRF